MTICVDPVSSGKQDSPQFTEELCISYRIEWEMLCLLGQGFFMHFFVCLLGPEQYLPPYAGLGLLQ